MSSADIEIDQTGTQPVGIPSARNRPMAPEAPAKGAAAGQSEGDPDSDDGAGPVGRPLVAAVAAFAAGQVAGGWAPAGIAAASAILLRRSKTRRRGAVFAMGLGAFAIAGWTRQTTQVTIGPRDVSRWRGSGYVTVLGSVYGEPTRNGSSATFSFATAAVSQPGGPAERCTGMLQCRLRGDAAALEVHHADTLAVSGVIETPREAGNPGTLDSAGYLKRHGVFACMTVRHAPGAQPIGESNGLLSRIPRLALAWRASLLHHLREHLSTEHASTLTGIVLGGRSGLRPETRDAFVRSGASHILAASGLNVALFVGALLLVASASGLSRQTRAALGIPAAAFYAVAAGCEPGAVRAAIMASVYLGAAAVDRLPDPPSALAAAALAALAYDPGCLWDAGFQLSFGIVSIAIAVMPLWEIVFRRLATAPEATAPRWRLMRWTAARAAFGSVALSITAAAAAAPLTAYWFRSVALVAPITNALTAPMVGLLLPATLASWILGYACSPLGEAVCRWVLDPVLSLMLQVVRVLGGLPVAQLNVGAVQVSEVAAVYALMCVAIAGMAHRLRPERP